MDGRGDTRPVDGSPPTVIREALEPVRGRGDSPPPLAPKCENEPRGDALSGADRPALEPDGCSDGLRSTKVPWPTVTPPAAVGAGTAAGAAGEGAPPALATDAAEVVAAAAEEPEAAVFIVPPGVVGGAALLMLSGPGSTPNTWMSGASSYAGSDANTLRVEAIEGRAEAEALAGAAAAPAPLSSSAEVVVIWIRREAEGLDGAECTGEPVLWFSWVVLLLGGGGCATVVLVVVMVRGGGIW
jgi:hypothetical protein